MDTQMQKMITLFIRRAAPEQMARQLETLRTMLIAVTQKTLSGAHNGAVALAWQSHTGRPCLSEETEHQRALGDIAALQVRCELLPALS